MEAKPRSGMKWRPDFLVSYRRPVQCPAKPPSATRIASAGSARFNSRHSRAMWTGRSRELRAREAPLFFPCRHAARDLGDIVGPGRAGVCRVVGEGFGQIFEAGAGVAPQRDLGREAAADLLGDDLEMDDRNVARRQRVALGCDLAEL